MAAGNSSHIIGRRSSEPVWLEPGHGRRCDFCLPRFGGRPHDSYVQRNPAGAGARRLRGFSPYGPRDLLAQIGVWLVFGLAYEAVRGAVGHERVRAFDDARSLIAAERGLHAFFEASLQRGLVAGSTLEHALAASYWLSEFALLVVALAYTYFRRREVYRRFRNAVLIANGLGLVGYLAFPAAPPRLFPADGFRNVLSGQPLPVHPTGLIGFAGNPYAAMPSLHIADAILVAVFLGSLSRSRAVKIGWFLWPSWLAYVVLVTGNHFWLDVVAGAAVAAAGLFLPILRESLAGYAHDHWRPVDSRRFARHGSVHARSSRYADAGWASVPE